MTTRAWTRERPIKAGWYWWRGHNRPEELVRVNRYNGVFWMAGFVDDPEDCVMVNYVFALNECGGEWSGPIDPPREAREEG